MCDIALGFVLLRQAVAVDNQLSTRQLDVRSSTGEPLRIAVDREDRKHLLIPVSEGEQVTTDTRSSGVWLTEMTLVEHGRALRFAALVCQEPHLDLVFERLVDDVVTRVAAGETTADASHTALSEWRAMLRAGSGLGRDEIIGLIGELELLRLIGRHNPVAALRAWTGPRRTVHDFVHGGKAIETKATAAADGSTVSVNGLDQLDPAEVDSLHLAVVHCRPDDSVADLDDRIRRLMSLGFPRTDLLDAVRQTGYVFEAESPVTTRYLVRSVRLWNVAPGFPGLRRSFLPESILKGITQVRYDLALSSAPERMPDAHAEAFIIDWLSQ